MKIHFFMFTRPLWLNKSVSYCKGSRNQRKAFQGAKGDIPSAVLIFFTQTGKSMTFLPDFIEIGMDILNPVQVTGRDIEKAQKPIIRTDNPSLAFVKIVSSLAPSEVSHPKGIDKTAIVGKNVSLGKNVAIGAYAVIDDGESRCVEAGCKMTCGDGEAVSYRSPQMTSRLHCIFAAKSQALLSAATTWQSAPSRL
jgi:hypothetical protein